MTLPSPRAGLSGVACALMLALAAPAAAETITMKADLKGSSEVPPVNTIASGSVTATFDTASKKLTWKGSIKGLSGTATAAHFHAGEVGKNGGVAIPITGAEKASFEGSATLTDAQAADLMAGKWYVNIHTAANKAGEIRGQMLK